MERRVFELTVAEFQSIIQKQLDESAKEIIKELKLQQHIAVRNYSDVTNVEGAVLLTGLARGTIYNRVSAGTIPIISRTPLRFSKIQLLSWLSKDESDI
jgi:hypothetical protein